MALLSVIMVMLVLGMLAALLAESVGGRFAATTLAQLTRQADAAARAGLEIGRARALQSSVCSAAQFQIAGMTVDIACTTQTVDEDGTVYPIYEISAVASHGTYGDFDHVRRGSRGRYALR